MKRSTRKAFVSLVAIGAMSSAMMLSSTAFAQDVKSTDTEGGYGYEFSDDPLNAGGFGPNDATIRVPPARSAPR